MQCHCIFRHIHTEALGIVALVTMTMLYLSLVGIQRAPEKLGELASLELCRFLHG